jgi:hypothetical protein
MGGVRRSSHFRILVLVGSGELDSTIGRVNPVEKMSHVGNGERGMFTIKTGIIDILGPAVLLPSTMNGRSKSLQAQLVTVQGSQHFDECTCLRCLQIYPHLSL